MAMPMTTIGQLRTATELLLSARTLPTGCRPPWTGIVTVRSDRAVRIDRDPRSAGALQADSGISEGGRGMPI